MQTTSSKEAKAKELFAKYDQDNSGKISLEEFQLLLPDIGIELTTLKSIEYFNLCDADGSGEIDFDEFKVCLFVCDDEGLNPLGFNPGNILRPKDAFILFDKDQSGKIDEIEFHFVLKYLGIDIDEGTHEKTFNRYDNDGSGFIEYDEFKQAWLRLTNPKKELEDRGLQIPTLATRPQMIRMLDDILKEEEEKEKIAILEAKRWREEQLILQYRKKYIDRALWRSHEELSAALDAGGQVYVFGSGSLNQFSQSSVRHPHHQDDLSDPDEGANDLLDRLWKRRIQGIWVSKEDSICENKDPDHAPVSSSPFKGLIVQQCTVSLWARGINGVAISDSTIITHAFDGKVYSWGGNERWWHDIEAESCLHDDVGSKLTGRSRVMQGSLPALGHHDEDGKHSNSSTEKVNDEIIPYTLGDGADRFSQLKRVLQYYDVYKAPGDGEDPLQYAEKLLQNNIKRERLVVSLQLRGRASNKMTKMQMIHILHDEIDAECRVLGEAQHFHLRKLEKELVDFRTSRKFKLAKRRQVEFADRRRVMKTLLIPPPSEAKTTDTTKIKSNETTKIKSNEKHILFQARASPLSIREWKSISAGANHAGLLDNTGQLYTYGSNAAGQLGLIGDGTNERSHFVHRPTPVRGMCATDVSCGYSHTVAISGGNLYVWGSTTSGKLGLGKEAQECITKPAMRVIPKAKVCRVSCGSSHTACATNEGKLYVWGCNGGYRLGLGDCHDRHTPTLVSSITDSIVNIACGNYATLASSCISRHSSAINKTKVVEINGGDLFVGGRILDSTFKSFGQYSFWNVDSAEIPPGPVKQLSAGFSHQAAVTIDGELFTWGDNRGGCCGHDPLLLSVSVPRRVDCLNVRPNALALDRPTRGSSTFGNQPFHEIDLGSQCTIHEISLWNDIEDPVNPAVKKGGFASCIFPFWLMMSQKPFPASLGGGSLDEALKISVAKKRFSMNCHKSTLIPPRQSKARYVRVQLENTNLLVFMNIEVFGVRGTDYSVGHVSSAKCGKRVTAAVIKSIKNEDDILLGYKRAVFADKSNKGILDQFDIYNDCSSVLYEQTNAAEPCILCRGTQLCEKCQLKFEFRNILDSKLAPKDMDCLSCISTAVLDLSKYEINSRTEIPILL